MKESMGIDRKATLSVCLIVKNEERFLQDCLQSVRDVADQIVVLDTGSTDRTVQIAREHHAEVHSFKWCNDFAAARNASIQPATGDWVLWIDADERLMPASIAYLKDLDANEVAPVIGQVQINNKSNDDADVHISTAFRLFRNHKGISFYGIIHEQLTALNLQKVKTLRTKVQIEHLGYALEDDVTSQKLLRNGLLLEKQIKNQPNNAYAHFTLAQNYNLLKEPTKAIIHFEKAYALKQFKKELTATLLNVWSESCLQLGQTNRALDLAKRSVSLEKKQVGGHYLLYKIYKNSKDISRSLKAIQNMREGESYINDHGWQIGTDVLLGNEKLNFAQAELEAFAGNWPEATRLYGNLITARPEDIALKAVAGKMFLMGGKFAEAEGLLTTALQQDSSRLDILELLGILYIKTSYFDRAINIYEALHVQAPDNQQVSRRLAGLYVKTGAEDKAAMLL